MSRFGYSKLHKYKAAKSRRLFLLRRALAQRHPPSDTKATAATVYWVGDDNSDWGNAANWAISSGGVGGVPTAGVPKATTAVIFDGAHTHGCVLGTSVQCANMTFGTGAGTPVATLDMNGKGISCASWNYDVADDTTVVLDGEIEASGALFTVTAMHATAAAAFLAGGTIVLEENCTVASAVALPFITAEKNFTTTAALEVARLAMSTPGSTMTFSGGNDDFTLTSYTAGDWDGDAVDDVVIVSDDASTWDFINPASMVVSYINVQDSNATNAIDATDNCTDGTGNTNWTFV